MILHPATGTPVVSLKSFAEDADFVANLLASERIPIPTGSPLQRAIEAARSVAAGTPTASPKDAATIAGLAYLARLLAAAVRSGHRDAIRGHLRHLADPVSNPFHTLNADSLQPRNMVLELEAGCLAASCQLPIALADEPDVQILGGESWDIACKSITTKNTASVGDHVEKGIDQVLRFNGDYGLVVLGLSNRVEHDTFLPILDPNAATWGSYVDFDAPIELLTTTLERFAAELQIQATTRFLRARDETKFRGVLLVSHTIAAVHSTPTLLTAMRLVTRKDLFDSPSFVGPEERLATRLNNAAHRAFSG